MPYYQTLKERRLSLGLSVLDVSAQTRLKPEFIRAIEEHNLDLFSDDFSYVRYFVHAYADAIGVNWAMIKDEVDRDVNRFAQARDGALRKAQTRMIETMPSIQTKSKTIRSKRRKRKRSFLENSAGNLSRRMSWGNLRLGRVIALAAGAAMILLLGLSWVQNSAASSAVEKRKAERTSQLAAQEQETQRLADDLKARKGDAQSSEPEKQVIHLAGTEEENVYTVEGFTFDHSTIHLTFNALGGQSVTVTWNGVPAFSEAVNGQASYDLQAGMSGQLVVTFQVPSVYNSLTVEDTPIPANYTLRDDNGGNRIVLNIVYSDKKEDTSSSNSSSQSETSNSDEENQTVTPEEPLYEDPGYDPGYTEEIPSDSDEYAAPIDEGLY